MASPLCEPPLPQQRSTFRSARHTGCIPIAPPLPPPPPSMIPKPLCFGPPLCVQLQCMRRVMNDRRRVSNAAIRPVARPCMRARRRQKKNSLGPRTTSEKLSPTRRVQGGGRGCRGAGARAWHGGRGTGNLLSKQAGQSQREEGKNKRTCSTWVRVTSAVQSLFSVLTQMSPLGATFGW